MGTNCVGRARANGQRDMAVVRTATVLLVISVGTLAGSPSVHAQECAYRVYPGSWLNTGFQVRAGQTLEIQASGTNRYKDGARIEFGVGGDMYSVWSLTAKVGSQIEDLDGGAIFTAEQSGVLELGVPAKADTPVEDAAEYLDTSYSLCVNVFQADHGGGLTIGLEDCPREVWVGWGRPSMACVVCIRGFRTNTPDPVVLDCPGAFDEWGDHADAGGDRLKTIRVFACGASAQTYDWAGQYECPDSGPGGYPWGIFVSAPAEDLENNTQPGRRSPICLGTNPVRLRVSQGQDTAEVTLAPEIVLTQGGVGGGGSYENWTECGDDGGGGGGAGGGAGCGLGRWWEERENIWTGTWTRRGGSSVFDGHFERP
jgi:hypothetical protein